MANISATFGAASIKDVWTLVVSLTWATSDTVVVTMAGMSLTITVGSAATTADVATAIKQAFNSESMTNSATCIPQGGGQTIGPMCLYVASVSGSTVTFTARTAGVPRTMSFGSTTAGDGTVTPTHTTTGTGPTDWSNTSNWSSGSVPVDGDDVTINLPGSFTTGLDQTGVDLASLTLGPRFNGQIGLKVQNVTTASYPFFEDEDTELTIGATVVTNNSACTLVRINELAIACTVTSSSTGTSAETGRNAFEVRGTNASNVLNISGGDNGFAPNNETAVVATINQTGGAVVVGTGTTLTTLAKQGGTATINCAATTISSSAGSVTQTAGNLTTFNLSGGTGILNGSGSITTINMVDGTLNVASTRGTITTLNKTAGTAVVLTTVTTVINQSGSLSMTTGNITTATNGGTFTHTGATTITTLNQLDGSVTLTNASSVVTTLNKTAGTCSLAGSCATSTNIAGALSIGSGNVTSLTSYAGSVVYGGTATITAAVLYGGLLDLRTSDITLLTVYDGTATVSRAGTLATLRQSGGSVTVLASATAVTTIDKSGGQCDVYVAAGTVTNEGGNITLRSGNSTAITVTSGYARYNGAGTLTAVTLSNSAVFDVDGATNAMTITTLTLSDNAKFDNKTGRASVTNYVIPAGSLKLTAA